MNNRLKINFIAILLIFSHISGAQNSVMQSNMMRQLQNMSPSQIQNLAGQYGIDNQLISPSSRGYQDNIQVNPGMDASLINNNQYLSNIDENDNKERIRRLKNQSKTVFESDYSIINDLPIFGSSLFVNVPINRSPTYTGPVPDNYIIGPGDSLNILMYGSRDQQFELTVNRSGQVDFPEIGALTVAGMSFSDASNFIKNQISESMIGVELNISIGSLRNINVFLAGEAKTPGSYNVPGLLSISQLILAAGGVSDIGSLRNIKINREGGEVALFDLYEIIADGDVKNDIKLRSGDVVFIPPIKKVVYIDGAVRRPGRYELKDNEVINDVMMLAGGFTDRAFIKQISLERYDKKEALPFIINLDLTRIENLSHNILDGDLLRVPEISSNTINSIQLKGAIHRPGSYGWYDGIRLSDLIKNIHVDLEENADLSYGLISRRLNTDRNDIKVVAFYLGEMLKNPKSEFDVHLKPYDQIFIFSKGDIDDSLNNKEVYDPELDENHPSYLTSEDVELQSAQNTANLSNTNNPAMMNQYSQLLVSEVDVAAEYEIELYEREKQKDYYRINKGKRRLLLEAVIEKLLHQASSNKIAKIVSISGAVKVPGQYPMISGATYQDLILLAGGYTEDAYLSSAELRRTNIEINGGSRVNETINVNLDTMNKVELNELDHLHIKSIKDWDSRDSVILRGEVSYPGTYLISPNEKLSSIIRRAGGFTNESFIEGAIFTREGIKDKEREQLQILGDAMRRNQAARSMTKEAQDFSLSSSEVEAGITALLSTEVFGRLIIDIPGVISGDTSADISLLDGDVITIPKFNNAVTVVGEVRRPGSFVLQEEYQIDDYVELAAGMTVRGDKQEIYIISADGSVRKNLRGNSFLTFDGGNNNVRAGDTIVIPIKSSYQTPLNLYSTVSQVIFQSIASIAAFSTILN